MVILGVVLMAFGLIYLDELLYFFGASDQTLPYAREYMRIILYGNVITHLYHGLNCMLRVAGYPNKAMIITIVAVVLNAILDAVFILWLKWGIAGSAWATVIGQTVPLMLQIIHFSKPTTFLRFRRGIFRLSGSIIKSILSIGMAPFMIQSCACVVVIIVNNTLATHGGDLQIGAYGIANRVAFLFTMVVLGLSQGMQPIVGYNYGAKKYDRVRKILFMTMAWGTAITTVGFVVCEVFPREVVRLFVSEDGSGDATKLIEATVHGMRVLLLMFPVVGFSIIVGNFFQFIGKAKRAIILSMTRQLLFIVPLLLILPKYWGSDGVWYSIPIADAGATLLAAVLLIYQLRKLRLSPDSESSI